MGKTRVREAGDKNYLCCFDPPRLWRNTQWGQLESSIHLSSASMDVRGNRSLFVRCYRIKNGVGAYRPKYVQAHFGRYENESNEIYRDLNGNWVLVAFLHNNEAVERLTAEGWHRHEPLIEGDLTTMVKVVHARKRTNKNVAPEDGHKH